MLLRLVIRVQIELVNYTTSLIVKRNSENERLSVFSFNFTAPFLNPAEHCKTYSVRKNIKFQFFCK